MSVRIKEIFTGRKVHTDFWKAAVMALLPLLCCVTACALQGRSIADVSLAAGEWNDELFYFKQVEGIVHFGYPQGYFGFNESHALKASFAAWSPVLVFPWILWGLIFGWNLSSPIYCNIFLMMLAMFLFVRLVKPSVRQLAVLTLLYAGFTPLTRYMLSGMPECICFALVIIVLALDLSYMEKEHPAKLMLLFLLTAVMTLMRPYLLLFMFLPAWFWFRKNHLAGSIGTLGIMGVTGAVYALVKHYFGAEYFTPLFDTTWVTTFFREGIFAGIKYLIWRLVTVGWSFCKIMFEGLRSDLFYGEYFAAFTAVLLFFLIQSIRCLCKKEKKRFVFNLHLLFCFVGMLTALLLMYKMQEGSKHLLTFVAAGIYGVSLADFKTAGKRRTEGIMAAAVVAVFLLLFLFTPVVPYEHQIPFDSEGLEVRERYWEEVFDEECGLVKDDVPNFDNVVIWVFNDEVAGEAVLTPYQMLYRLPAGFGISCCYADYVLTNYERLQSRYLAVTAGGRIDEMCRKNGSREIGRDESLVVYELRKSAKQD